MKFELPTCTRCYSKDEALIKTIKDKEPSYFQESHTFQLNNIAVLQIDKDNKKFYDFVIPRSGDVLSNFRSNISFKIVFWDNILDVCDIDYILFFACLYTEFKCRFYLDHFESDFYFRLSYNCTMLPLPMRFNFSTTNEKVETDYLTYYGGVCEPLIDK